MWTGTRDANNKGKEKQETKPKDAGNDEGHTEEGGANYEENPEEETPGESDPLVDPDVVQKKTKNSKDANNSKAGSKEKTEDEESKGGSSRKQKRKAPPPHEKEKEPQKKKKGTDGEAKAAGIVKQEDGDGVEKKAPKTKPEAKQKAKAKAKVDGKAKEKAAAKTSIRKKPGTKDPPEPSSDSSSGSSADSVSTELDDQEEAAPESSNAQASKIKGKPAHKSTPKAKTKEPKAKATAAKSNPKTIRLRRLQSRVRHANDRTAEPAKPAAEAGPARTADPAKPAAEAGPAAAQQPAAPPVYDFFEEPQLHVAIICESSACPVLDLVGIALCSEKTSWWPRKLSRTATLTWASWMQLTGVSRMHCAGGEHALVGEGEGPKLP